MSRLPIRALLLAILWPAVAWSGDRTVLLVGELPDGVDPTIRRELLRRGVTVKDLASDYPVPQQLRGKAAATISQVEATIRSTEEQYYRIELEQMLAGLAVELQRSSTPLASMGRWDLLRALLLWQGVGFARSAKKQAALRSFSAAITVGAAPPKAGRFPPAVLALYTRAAQQVAARPKVRLVLKVSPAAAAIEIDGRKITEPRAELATGTHWVVVRALGFETISKEISIDSATTLPVQLELASVSRIAQQVAASRASGALDPTRPHVAAALGRLAGTTEVLVVVQGNQSSAGKLVSFSRVRSADGTLLGRQAEMVGSSSQRSAARRAIARLWSRAAVVDKKRRSRPFYKKWWFWTAVGVMAVAGTTAAIFATADWKDTYTINLVRP